MCVIGRCHLSWLPVQSPSYARWRTASGGNPGHTIPQNSGAAHLCAPLTGPLSAGAIPLLVGVLRSGTDAAKQHAARALRNLGAWPEEARGSVQSARSGTSCVLPLKRCLVHPAARTVHPYVQPPCPPPRPNRHVAPLPSPAAQPGATHRTSWPPQRQGASPCWSRSWREQRAPRTARGKRQPAHSGARQEDAVPRQGNGLQAQRAQRAAPARQQPMRLHGPVWLVGWLEWGPSSMVQVVECVRWAECWAECVGLRVRRKHAHATPALSLTLTHSSPPPPTPSTSPACSNIACNCEQTQKAIVAENALPALADLLHPDSGCSDGCREAAAWALSNLACSSDVRNELG